MAEATGPATLVLPDGVLRRWEEAVAHAPTVQGNPRETIVPPSISPDAAGRQALELLVKRGPADGIVLAEPIGQGGMGIVHRATQLSLGRQVAVKTLKPTKTSESAAMKLLREAWILGELEHPNVMPVYDVGLDDNGRPLVVLKHVQGVVWRRLMNDAAAVRARGGARDVMEFNLGILMQVCHAMAFAHSRGIIHRDLKPDNVMIGEFGEVYVLDWGLALSLRDDASGRLPLASALGGEIAGTPCYMAPEMMRGDALDARTDVYLLGAVLYELLSGAPPHAADDPLDMLHLALASRPPPPPGAPAELVAIALKAMSPAPADRHPTAEALRLALMDYLSHRGSARLADTAMRRLDELKSELTSSADQPSRRIAIYRLFGECRFGFREALERWPDNAVASRGVARAFEAMVGYELQQKDAGAAASLLGELTDPPPELRARVEAALRAEEVEKKRLAELERLGRELDRRVGQRARMAIGVVLGGVSSVVPLLMAMKVFEANETFSQGVTWPAFFLVLVAVLGYATRGTMLKTAINRRLLGGIVLLLAAQTAMTVGIGLLGLSPTIAVVLQLLVWSCIIAMMALALDGWLYPTAAGYVLAFLVAARWPEHRYYAIGISNLIMTVNVVIIWGRRDRQARSRR
jgi:serine/threonine-protein kinase